MQMATDNFSGDYDAIMERVAPPLRLVERDTEYRYYIGVGLDQGYYTLRVQWEEPTWSRGPRGEAIPGLPRTRDRHIRNLGNTVAKALAAADRYEREQGVTIHGKDDLKDDLRKIGRGREPVFGFGKYRGELVADVWAKDPDYVLWMAGEPGFIEKQPKSFQRVIMDLAGDAIEQARVDAERERERIRRETERQRDEQRKRWGWLADWLEAERYGGNFVQDMITTIRNGNAPRGRAVGILANIYAKDHGRRNSKAYNDALDEFYRRTEQ